MKKNLFSLVSLILTAILITTYVSASPREDAEPGEAYNIVYYEEFNYENTEGNDAVAKLLGWKILSKADNTAVAGNTASYSVKDGRLYIENNKSGAADSYIMVLNDSKMAGTWMHDYTVQYDVTLTSAGNTTRYIALLTDYMESTKGYYNSFHLRINGTANNQARHSGDWLTYDAPGDCYAADADDTDGTPTIAKKLLGKDYDGSQVLKNISLTIRIVNDVYDIGPRVYVRNNSDGGDFILVSQADPEGSQVYGLWRNIGGKAIVLKAGGAINGYIDNILVYKGTGEPVWEEIKAPETTAEPETAALPETGPESEPLTEPEITEEESESGCASTVSACGMVILAIAAATVWKKK